MGYTPVRAIRLKDWSEKFEYPNVAAMRSYYFNRHKNGSFSAFRKVGAHKNSPVYVDPTVFLRWLHGG